MAKDYAKYSSKSNKSLATSGWRKRLLIVIMLLLLVSAIIGGIVVYKKYSDKLPIQTISRWVTHVKSVMVRKKARDEQSPQAADNDMANSEPEIKFNFYNELPNMQVTLPEKETEKVEPPIVKPQKVVKPLNQYVVQLGAYESESAASQVRVSLLLSGIEVDIVEEMSDNKPVYRIQQGPFSNNKEAGNALKKLKSKGVDGIVKKIS